MNQEKGIQIIPRKERIRLRNKKIKELYKIGYDLPEICKLAKVSKTTAFFAIRGRSKKMEVKDK